MDRPKLDFDIKVNDELKTVKMTYGLFNEILTIVPGPEDIAELFVTNASLRDYVARRMLSGSKKITKEEDLVDPFDLDVDMDQINDLIAWVGEHVLYFFMNSAEKTAKLMKVYLPMIEEIQSSQSKNGLEDSTSPTPSAGPSDAAKAT